MKKLLMIASLGVLVLAGATAANAGMSFQFGSDGFFLSVGDYDYLPYAHSNDPGWRQPRINFHDMMSQYGRWVNVSPFGRVWRPYASHGWRPYAYGHWIYTEYGPFWEGYEPWAWAGYHYGSWIFTRRHGWTWIPGYDWHPGRVSWAHGYDTVGWMPRPPDGYDYRRGSLTFVGRNNQFTYSDDDFGSDSYYSEPWDRDSRGGGPYYDPSGSSLNVNLWVFIDGSRFGEDNYADYDLGADYTRYAFDEREVRISNRPMDQEILEGLIQQPIQRVSVDVSELRTDQRPIRVVVPSGSASIQRIREQSPGVVQQVIAPAFAQEQRSFKGNSSKMQGPISRIFGQGNSAPRMETRSRDQVLNQAREAQQVRERQRVENLETAKKRVEELKSERRVDEPGNRSGRAPRRLNPGRPVDDDRNPNQVRDGSPLDSKRGPGLRSNPRPPDTPQVPSEPVAPSGPPLPLESTRPPAPFENRGANERPMNRGNGERLGPPRAKNGSMRMTPADAAVTNDAIAALRTQLPALAGQIEIRASGGVVSVSGRVANSTEEADVLRVVSSVKGAKSVASRIAIGPVSNR